MIYIITFCTEMSIIMSVVISVFVITYMMVVSTIMTTFISPVMIRFSEIEVIVIGESYVNSEVPRIT